MVLEQRFMRKLLETAIVAARLAGQRAMEELGYIKSSIKNSDEMVTQADVKCQKIIIDRIKENYPDHGFIAEEGQKGKIFKQPPRGSEQIWWLIDPIDGTNNFAHRMLLFTVSIAAMYKGEPVVGVVFEPATDSMFAAVKGREAQLNGRKISTGNENLTEFSSVGLDSHFVLPIPDWVEQLVHKTRFRNLGTTALQIAYVARAGLVATVVCRPKLWDIAAGTIIAQTAGALVTDFKGEKIFPVDLDRYEGEELQVLVANKKVHPQLVKMINP